MERNFVESGSVHDEGALDAECIQRFGNRSKKKRIRDSKQLDLRTRRIQAWAEKVHDGPDLERAAHRSGVGDARMVLRREKEAEAGVVEDSTRFLCRQVELRS